MTGDAGEAASLPRISLQETAMHMLRIVVLVGSAALAGFGVLVMAGVFEPPNFPRDYRVILGAVVTLYGIYRFAIAYYRKYRGRGEQL
jgi:hypothetical protein